MHCLLIIFFHFFRLSTSPHHSVQDIGFFLPESSVTIIIKAKTVPSNFDSLDRISRFYVFLVLSSCIPLKLQNEKFDNHILALVRRLEAEGGMRCWPKQRGGLVAPSPAVLKSDVTLHLPVLLGSVANIETPASPVRP